MRQASMPSDIGHSSAPLAQRTHQMRSRHQLTRLMTVIGLAAVVAGAVPGIASAEGSPSPAGGPVASPGSGGSLGTAEDAVRSYLAGVIGADLAAVLAASAVDEASQGFDLQKYVDRMGMFDPFGPTGPAEYPFYAAIDATQLTARIATQV